MGACKVLLIAGFSKLRSPNCITLFNIFLLRLKDVVHDLIGSCGSVCETVRLYINPVEICSNLQIFRNNKSKNRNLALNDVFVQSLINGDNYCTRRTGEQKGQGQISLLFNK